MSDLDNWLKVIELTGKTGVFRFYEATLKAPVSNTQQLEWALDAYGTWPIIEAVLAASKRKIDDPLNYVLAVAQAKWKESFLESSESDKYARGIERSKNRIAQQNEELEQKLAKAKEIGNVTS